MKKSKLSHRRITISIPESIASKLDKIPSQKRSKWISSIIEQEFKRQQFQKNLEKIKVSGPILSANFKLESIPDRKINEISS